MEAVLTGSDGVKKNCLPPADGLNPKVAPLEGALLISPPASGDGGRPKLAFKVAEVKPRPHLIELLVLVAAPEPSVLRVLGHIENSPSEHDQGADDGGDIDQPA